ncbi:IDE [Enterospora canceri]|uniref:IDE n=1 Tax=Enterospora canceri TaxID=1081671 RepID=A0A1Y1S964_9MICR|nr:IDE [Enterospora canceri]
MNEVKQVITSKVDKNDYELVELENGTRVVLVSNSEFDTAACAVSMGVGTFNNPKEIPGLSHFLEHMLFMGSKKYPSENYFMELVSKFGGYTNAYTASEITCYYSSIHKDELNKLIDALAGFFIDPLMKEDGVGRELNAVHSEYTNGISSQSRREYELKKQFMLDTSSLKKFGCGNLSTLKIDHIREKVVDFYHKNYSSEKCVVVVCGVEPLGKLREMVQIFGKVKSNNQKNDKTKAINQNIKTRQVFQDEYLGKVIRCKSLNKRQSLSVEIMIDPTKQFYKENPIGYIAHLFESKEKGCLLNKLQNSGFGYDVSMSSNEYDEMTWIDINIGLTDIKHRKKVLQMVYDELKRINKTISRAEYDRIRQIKKIELDYVDSMEPIDLVEEFAANMQGTPYEYALHGELVFEEYNEILIRNILRCLMEWKKWFVLEVTDDLNGKGVLDTVHDAIEYVDLKESIEIDENDESGSITQPNASDVVISDMKLIKTDVSKSDHIWQGRSFRRSGRLNSAFDMELGVPKGIITVQFGTIQSKNVAQLIIQSKVMIASFEEEYARMLENNCISISLGYTPSRILFIFEGFNGIIHEIVLKFFREVKINRNFIDNEINDLRGALSKNITGNPYCRSSQFFIRSVLGLDTEEEMVEKLNGITLDELVKFDGMKVLAVGNIDQNSISDIDQKLLKCDIITSDESNEQINLGKKEFSFQKHATKNNLLHRFHLVPDNQVHLGLLYIRIFSETFFDQLRTKEQLGYVVQLFTFYVKESLFISFRVQSEKSVEELKERFAKFINDSRDLLRDMKDEEIENYKSGLILNMREKKNSLTALNDHAMICMNRFEFDLNSQEKLADQISGITKKELIGFDVAELVTSDVTTRE